MTEATLEQHRKILGDVLGALTSGKRHRVMMDVAAFREVYQRVYKEEGLLAEKGLFGILFGNTALFWFVSSPNLEFLVSDKVPLSKERFAFVLEGHIVGSTEGRYSFARFAFDEIRSVRVWVAMAVSSIAVLALFFGAAQNSWLTVVEALIPGIGLFLSVFVLMMLPQRGTSGREALLLKSKEYFRWREIDKYVAWALGAGLLATLFSLIALVTNKEPLSDYIGTAAFQLGMLGVAIFLVAWAVISLISFYFGRAATIEEATAIPSLKELLQGEYEGRNDPAS